MTDPGAQLRRALGAEPPASVLALPPAVLQRLLGQIESGRDRHRRVAQDAMDTALRDVPLPVRGLIRRALR